MALLKLGIWPFYPVSL